MRVASTMLKCVRLPGCRGDNSIVPAGNALGARLKEVVVVADSAGVAAAAVSAMLAKRAAATLTILFERVFTADAPIRLNCPWQTNSIDHAKGAQFAHF